eukprot:766979-Hanusia_phi.AAC.3
MPRSFIAHSAMKNEKYRPETCCNYYSLKGQHEKAVLYFKRALQLDSHYLSAWTLMGHEWGKQANKLVVDALACRYVEIRNTAAAIEAYRRALDINCRDYRAWYGLGQVILPQLSVPLLCSSSFSSCSCSSSLRQILRSPTLPILSAFNLSHVSC